MKSENFAITAKPGNFAWLMLHVGALTFKTVSVTFITLLDLQIFDIKMGGHVSVRGRNARGGCGTAGTCILTQATSFLILKIICYIL